MANHVIVKPTAHILSCLLGLSFLAQAQAQSSASSAEANSEGGTMLQEIVVTAQKREERLQDVPIAVAALTGEQLANANVTSVFDLSRLTSGVVFQQTTGTATTFIRGLGNNQLTVGNEASVSLYIDGVYFSRITPILMRLDNVDRVEVLKGPQGTLFGRNATGGLINIVTSTPSPGQPASFSGMLGYGNYQSTEASLRGSTSLGAISAASLDLIYTDQAQGWGRNLYTEQDTFKERNIAGRFKFVTEFSENTKLTLAGDVENSDSTIGLLGPFSGPNPAPAGYADGSGLLPVFSSPYDKYQNLADLADTHGYGGYARLNQAFSLADLVATAAVHDERISYHNDIDKSPLTYFQFEENDTKDDQWSAELQLLSKKTSAVDWTGGLFFLKQNYGYPYPNYAKIYGDSFGPGVNVLVGDSGQTTSKAAYAQASFPIVSKLRGTLGVRYNRDEIEGHGLTDIQITNGPFIPGTPQSASVSYGKTTYRAALDYKFTDDVMLYGSVSTGTKAGLFNLVTFDPTPVKPESLTAYEIGLKSEFLDRRLRLNGAVFDYEDKDPQVQTQQPNGVTNLSNAQSARILGAELEGQFVVTSSLTLRASATYLDAYYTDYTGAPFYTPNPDPPYGLFPSVPQDASGKRLSRAPPWSANVGGNYSVRLPAGELNFDLNYTYTGAFYWNPDNLIRQPSYNLLDANVSYTFPNSAITLQLWGTNLSDAHYNLTANEFGGPVGVSSGPGAPRMYGVRVRFKY
jgi:iron complex outermembrane receptor protein